MRHAVVSGAKKQPAAARQGKQAIGEPHWAFFKLQRALSTASQQTRRPDICADWDSVSPLTFGGNGGANRQGTDSFLEPTELESLRCRAAGFSSIASPVLDSRTGFFHVRVFMARPRVSVLSLNCLGHVEKKRKLRPTGHNPCPGETGLNGFVPASFPLGEELPTSRDRSVPVLDAEQG